MTTNDRTTILQGYIDRMLEGDDAYRQRLVEHSLDRLRALVKKRMGGYPGVQRWEQTDDVLQQASLRLWKSLDEVKPSTVREFFGLAATQIRRTLIDLARLHGGKQGHGAHHATNASHIDKGRLQAEKSDRTNEPGNLAEWTEFHQAVERLPQGQRQMFDLLYYQGLTQPEAAALLDMPIRTLKRRWRETRQALYASIHCDGPAHDRSGTPSDE